MDTPAGLTLRLAEARDAPAILRLLQTAFDEWPAIPTGVSALEHLEWKMQPPGGIVARHTIGFVDGEAVAVDLRWMGAMQVHGETLLSNGGAEIAVRPDYQGHGFSRAIRDHEIRQTQPGEITLATANDQRADRYQTGMFIEDALRLWVRPLGVRARLGLMRARGGSVASRWRALAAVRRRGLAKAGSGYRCEDVDTFDTRFDALWETARHDYDLLRVRDAAYLNWRYADPRSGRTVIRTAFNGSEVVGYAVFRPHLVVPELLDLFIDPAHPAAAARLLADAIELFRQRGARAVSAALPKGHPYDRALGDVGFVAAGEGPTVLVGRPPNAERELDEIGLAGADARLHLTIGDFEYA